MREIPVRRSIISFFVFASLASGSAQAAVERLPNAWYDPDSPVPVMHLEGSIEEIAEAHGRFASSKPERTQTLLHFSQLLRKRAEDNVWVRRFPSLRWPLEWLYSEFIRDPLRDDTPDRYREAFQRFAEAAHVSPDLVFDALVLPDAALGLVGLAYEKELAPPLAISFGCTSVVWNSSSTSVLHGRNLDYEGVGYWDKNPVLLHVVPREGLAHVAVASLGVHATGITGFNEAGLTLAIHQLTSKDADFSGTPVAVIGAEILRNARSVDDAIELVRAFSRAGPWAFVVSRGHDRAVIETSANEVSVRRSSDRFFFQTNHVASPGLASHQIFYSPGNQLDTFERAERLEAISKQNRQTGWATPRAMISILGDFGSPARVGAGTIAKLENIQSVVMDPSHRTIWMGMGRPGIAPNQGEFVEVSWRDLRSPSPPRFLARERSDARTHLSREQTELRVKLEQASAAEDSGSKLARLEEFAALLAREPESAPLRGQWTGVFLLIWERLRTRTRTEISDLATMLSLLERSMMDAELQDSQARGNHREAISYHRLLGTLWQGRLLDLLGRRGEALSSYLRVLREAKFERIQVAAQRSLASPYSLDQAARIVIDWHNVDLLR